MSRKMLFRLGVVAVTMATFVVTGAAPALAADFQYWYAHPGTRILQETPAPAGARGSSQTDPVPPLTLSAARSEWEGRLLVMRSGATVENVVLEPSDLQRYEGDVAMPDYIWRNNVSCYWTHYVRVRTPSYGMRRISAYLPDALPPLVLENGRVVPHDVEAGRTHPFYVLFYVPEGTPAGTYRGTIRAASANAPEVIVPVQLRVYGFSVARRSLKTSFGMDLRWAKYTSTPNHLWPSRVYYPDRESTKIGADTIARWMRFMADHRVSPQTLAPGVDAPSGSGLVPARSNYLNDFLGSGTANTFEGDRLNFNTAHLPDGSYEPNYIDNPFRSSSNRVRAARYYRSMYTALRPWIRKSVVYTIDEPRPTQRRFVEQYGAFVHKYAPGAKFMVTLHGKRFGYKPLRNVDIFVQRLHFWWYDYKRWIVKIRRMRKQVWMYSHTTDHQAAAPLYLIDKPASDSRIQGWFAYLTGANGLLYYNLDRWQGPRPEDRWFRDPYRDPLSSVIIAENGRRVRSNGDGSLIYPGYYPALGLNVVGSAPVSSLRMEALRDGLEDYEYLKLLEARYGKTRAQAYVKQLINTRSFRDNFPRYTTKEYRIQAVRDAIATAIEQK